MIYQTKADKLVINNAKSDYKSYVYVAPTEDVNSSGLGRLFIIVETKSREKKMPTILNQIVDELSEYYYHSPTKNTEAALETTAQYFNENIGDITGKDLKWIKEKINILIAAIDENKLIISNYNNIKLWMFRDNKIHDITANQDSSKKPIGKKILSQLVSGQLNGGDILLLTNNAIFDYFSDDKIKKTVTTLAPTQACAFFKNTLLDYKANVDFSTIIIKLQAFKKEPNIIEDISHKKVLTTDREVDKLNQVEPKLIKKYLIFVSFWFGKTFDALKNIFVSKLAAIKNKQTVVSPPKDDVEEKIASLDKQEAQTTSINKIKKFKFLEYRLLILIIVVAGLFTGSLLMINNKQAVQEKDQQFQTTVDEIYEKINSIEAALIYKDNNRAQELLNESRELLTTLQGTTAEQQYIYQELEAEVESQINKIYKLEKISNPNVIADLPNDFMATSNLFIADNNIMYLARGGEVYKVNSENKNIDKVADITGQIKKIFSLEKGKLILTNNENKVWIMDINNYSTREVTLKLAVEENQLKSIDGYGKNIYALDAVKNNIYKYSYNNSTFGEPTIWLEQETGVINNNSIVVDGNVWLADNQGKISKFFKGKKEVFEIKGAYDTINGEIFMWTHENVNNLYLVDKDKNRIILSDKAGKVNKQLLGDDLEKIISIIPNENETELYIMTNNKIYKINL